MKSWKKADGMLVVTLKEGVNAGRLADFQFDMESRRIYGWLVKRGVWSGVVGVAASELTKLGRDVALVTGEAAMEPSGAARGTEDGRAWGAAYLGTRVMSRRGAAIGQVADLLVEAVPPVVVGIVLDQNRLVKPDDKVALGRDALILDDATVARAIEEKPDSVEWWAKVKAWLS